MKKLQFKRINDFLVKEFNCDGIISEGYEGNKNIIRLGFYPQGYRIKQYIIFNKVNGSYKFGNDYQFKVNYYLNDDNSLIEINTFKDFKKTILELYR